MFAEPGLIMSLFFVFLAPTNQYELPLYNALTADSISTIQGYQALHNDSYYCTRSPIRREGILSNLAPSSLLLVLFPFHHSFQLTMNVPLIIDKSGALLLAQRSCKGGKRVGGVSARPS